MSIDSPGENSAAAELNRQFNSLCISSENVNPNPSSEHTIKAEPIASNDSSRANSDLILMSIPPPIIKDSSECCSENESESSSLGVNYRKMGAVTPKHNPVRFEIGSTDKSRPIRAAISIKRAVSLPRATLQPSKYLTPLKQINRSNVLSPSSNSNSYRGDQPSPSAVLSNSVMLSRGQTRTPKPQKPNSLPHVQSRTCKPQVVTHANSVSSSKRIGTPGGPAADSTAVRIRSSMLSVELKSITASQNPYGTVPRRRKQKSVEDLLNGRSIETRSSSVSCDARMTTSVGGGTRKHLQLSCSGMSSNSSSAWTTPTQTHAGRWPNLNSTRNTSVVTGRKTQSASRSQRTRIYYEQSVQTTLTNDDMVKLFSGEFTDPGPLAVRAAVGYDCSDQETQCTDIRDIELEKLRGEVRSLSATLQREREEKILLQSELQLNTERVMSMLEIARINGIGGSGDGWTPTSEDDASTGTGSCSVSGHDSLLMLESQIQLSGHELVERQQEVRQLRQLCRSLQSEMQRSVATQQVLLQEKAAIEQESSEMQDFLQHEKTAMYDALRELEADFETCKAQLSHRDEDVKALREKCQFLVRLNEQRRQENLLLQTKYNAFQSKSRNFVVHQHSSISVAYAVLLKLHGRLRSLVDELKLTYNLSEQELEKQTIQYEGPMEAAHNPKPLENIESEMENGNNNGPDQYIPKSNFKPVLELPLVDDDDDGALSPQRHQTFIAAIISAIRSATTPSKRPLSNHQSSESHSSVTSLDPLATSNGNSTEYVDVTDMLDSETEPCLMMDNVLEDVKMPDTYSQNMVTKQNSFPPDIELLNILNTEVVPGESLSLQNLSQAIVNRQNIEMQANEDITEEVPNTLFGELLDAKSLIDKVKDVDGLVTRLLRLIQMDNDNCIQQLIVDKNKLQQHREEMLEKIRELQEVNIKLQDDLMDATQELMLKNNELSGKGEMQGHANEIDVRF